MKKILSLSLAFAIFLIPSLKPKSAPAESSKIERYLVVGFDDAAQNTDVIAVVTYDHFANRLTILQIPRDTYYRFGGFQNKLNQLYPHLLAGKTDRASKENAMRALATAISSMLGVKIDRYLGVSVADFEKLIDAMGGVSIFLEQPISYMDSESGESLVLHSGTHLLTGRQSSAFVRYRIGYPRGDLGRIDAQKTFISAMLAKFAGGMPLSALPSLLSTFREHAVTDISIPHAFRCGLRFVSSYKATDIRYLTLPGEPCMHKGVSYYVVNRASAEEAVSSWLCFGLDKAIIDRDSLLFSESVANISEIYHRNSIPYFVYTDAELQHGS